MSKSLYFVQYKLWLLSTEEEALFHQAILYLVWITSLLSIKKKRHCHCFTTLNKRDTCTHKTNEILFHIANAYYCNTIETKWLYFTMLKYNGCVLQCWNLMVVFYNVELETTWLCFTMLKSNGCVLQCWNLMTVFYNVELETTWLCFTMLNLKPHGCVLQCWNQNDFNLFYNIETKWPCFTMLKPNCSVLQCWNEIALFCNVETKRLCFTIL